MNMFKRLLNDKKLSALLLIIFVILIILIVLFFYKRNLNNINNSDYVSLNCSDYINESNEVDCFIELNSVSMNVQGISLSYKLSDGIQFSSFSNGDGWISPNITTLNEFDDNLEHQFSDGLVLLNDKCIRDNSLCSTGKNVIGSIKFKVSDIKENNDVFRVGLVDVIAGDGENNIIKFSDVYDDIRIATNNTER